MSGIHLLHSGNFGEALRALCEAEGDAVRASRTAERTQGAGAVWLVMGQADLRMVERAAESATGPTVAAFLFARYLVVTPCFHDTSVCARCFRRRFLSRPPPGVSTEAALALTMHADLDSGFDSPAYAPALPAIARLLLKRQTDARAQSAILIDQAGLQHRHAPLVAVHGCECRGERPARNRFTAFHSELLS